jgi:hypothetical protein
MGQPERVPPGREQLVRRLAELPEGERRAVVIAAEQAALYEGNVHQTRATSFALSSGATGTKSSCSTLSKKRFRFFAAGQESEKRTHPTFARPSMLFAGGSRPQV